VLKTTSHRAHHRVTSRLVTDLIMSDA